MYKILYCTSACPTPAPGCALCRKSMGSPFSSCSVMTFWLACQSDLAPPSRSTSVTWRFCKKHTSRMKTVHETHTEYNSEKNTHETITLSTTLPGIKKIYLKFVYTNNWTMFLEVISTTKTLSKTISLSCDPMFCFWVGTVYLPLHFLYHLSQVKNQTPNLISDVLTTCGHIYVFMSWGKR